MTCDRLVHSLINHSHEGMRLSTLPATLFSLLVVLVLLVDSAPAQADSEGRPPNGVKLDPDNFHELTSKGTWCAWSLYARRAHNPHPPTRFVEFFSPYCAHCRHFAPTWKELVADVYKIPNLSLKMGQMNCAVHGGASLPSLNPNQLLTVIRDKCQELKVSGWPQLNLYKDGEFVDTFKKARELKALKEYLDKHLVSETHPPPSPPPKAPARILNPEGKVLELDERNFSDEIKKGGAFVKFFAPWCGHCKKLAPTWAQLAEQMRNQLTIAEVNCEEHSALCRAEDVQGYPMLFYYGDDGAKTEYTGGRKPEQLQGFLEKVLKP